jgi:hypothetical protein
MKRLLPTLFIFALILSGCGSSKKQLQRGNYDAAIIQAVKELRRNPDNEKQADILEQSYRVATEQDNDRVRLL